MEPRLREDLFARRAMSLLIDNCERHQMAKEHSSVFQARADDAEEEMKDATLASAKDRFERARDAWQGLADDAREREAEMQTLANARLPARMSDRACGSIAE